MSDMQRAAETLGYFILFAAAILGAFICLAALILKAKAK